MSYQLSKTVLNNSDRERLVCALLHAEGTVKINMEEAAQDFGSSSANSFRVMYSEARKKLKNAVAEATGEEIETTPMKSIEKTGGKKRKADAGAAASDEPNTPTKKGRRGTKKQAGSVDAAATPGNEAEAGKKIKEEAEYDD